MRANVFLSIGATFACCSVACVATRSSERTAMQRFEEEQQGKSTEEKRNRFEMNLTESIDRLLPLLSKLLVESKMDPLTIPDARRSFWIVGPLLFPPVAYTEFTYSFSSASLHYLSEVEPDGAVVVSYADQEFNIDVNVAFDSLLLSSDYFLKLPFLQKRGKILAKASSIWARISIDVRVFSCRISLRKLKLNDIEFITIFPQENSLLERWITSVGNVAMALLKNALIDRIEERAAALLREYLEPTDHRSCPWNGNLFSPI